MKTKHLIIAHRGESHDAPENTLAAIDLAWERNADAVEIDIHLTKDDKIVVIHDRNTKRTANANLTIKKNTLQNLKKLNFANPSFPKWNDLKIPSLNEVLRMIPADKKIIIEIKSSKKMIPFLKEELENSNLETKQIEIIAFDLNTLKAAKAAMPEYKMLWLLNLDHYWLTGIFPISVNRIISKVKRYKIDGLDVWGCGKRLNQHFAAKVKAADLLLYTWTIDDPLKALTLLKMGVDGITSNKASWLKSQLNKQSN